MQVLSWCAFPINEILRKRIVLRHTIGNHQSIAPVICKVGKVAVILTIFYAHGKLGEGGFALFIDHEYVDVFVKMLFIVNKEIVLRATVCVIIGVFSLVDVITVEDQRSTYNNFDIRRMLPNCGGDLLHLFNAVQVGRG